MKPQKVALADCAPQPWRKGGGLTRELLLWPQSADASVPWQVRVTVADVAADGPFSSFPGIERWFAVLQGSGVALVLPNGTRGIGPEDEPLQFPGEAEPGCTLLDGPTRDLNLMVRRGTGAGSMKRAQPGDTLAGSTRWRGLFAASRVRLEVDGALQSLAPGTLLWSETPQGANWHLVQGRQAYWMALR